MRQNKHTHTHMNVSSDCPQLLLNEELVHDILAKMPQTVRKPNGTQSLFTLSVKAGDKLDCMLQKLEKKRKFKMCTDEVFRVQDTATRVGLWGQTTEAFCLFIPGLPVDKSYHHLTFMCQHANIW